MKVWTRKKFNNQTSKKESLISEIKNQKKGKSGQKKKTRKTSDLPDSGQRPVDFIGSELQSSAQPTEIRSASNLFFVMLFFEYVGCLVSTQK